MRTEHDMLGTRSLSDDTLYGLQTLRAKENFITSYHTTNLSLIYAMVQVKKAAALSYRELHPEESQKWDAILCACDRILAGDVDDAFCTSALQGGAGTSTNMNVNEVIANLALTVLGQAPGNYDTIHPLDDVNRRQSTNDVYPTALRIAAIQKLRSLSNTCASLQESLQKKELEFDHIEKLGRTELMDAMEVTLGSEFGAFAQGIARDRWRLYKIEERLRQVNLGGTAVGTGAHADRRYRYLVIEHLRNLTDIGLAAAEYPMDITQNQDVFVEVSGLLKSLAVNLIKIASDLRLMASGPFGGLHEITLPALQRGSTIMPGKVNPVIPEMVSQTAMRVIANDTAITLAASNGNFELNAFLPLIADSLLESLELLCETVTLFQKKCIDGIVADEASCLKTLKCSRIDLYHRSTEIGYDKAEEQYYQAKSGTTPE